MDNNDDAYRRGLELLDTLHGGHVGEVMVEEMKAICPDFATMTIEWAISGIMGRPGWILRLANFSWWQVA